MGSMLNITDQRDDEPARELGEVREPDGTLKAVTTAEGAARMAQDDAAATYDQTEDKPQPATPLSYSVLWKTGYTEYIHGVTLEIAENGTYVFWREDKGRKVVELAIGAGAVEQVRRIDPL